VVDAMELWQVIAYFVPERSFAPPAATGTSSGPKPIRDMDVIHARLAAASAGKPPPLHIFGDVDLAD
jgi:hypothetical protein